MQGFISTFWKSLSFRAAKTILMPRGRVGTGASLPSFFPRFSLMIHLLVRKGSGLGMQLERLMVCDLVWEKKDALGCFNSSCVGIRSHMEGSTFDVLEQLERVNALQPELGWPSVGDKTYITHSEGIPFGG